MIKEFEIQLKKTKAISFEDFQQLEDTTFHLDGEKVILNLKYKYYFSGREKKIGDIVLTAVLSTFVKNDQGNEEIFMETITLHPDEIENFELYKIQPTVNETLFPLLVYKKKKPQEEDEINLMLNKVINRGFSSLTKEEIELLKNKTQN